MALANQRPVFTVSTNEEADGDDGDHGGMGPVMGNISVLYWAMLAIISTPGHGHGTYSWTGVDISRDLISILFNTQTDY